MSAEREGHDTVGGGSYEERCKKGLKGGIKALKEIRKYQLSTDLLKRRLPFQRMV